MAKTLQKTGDIVFSKIEKINAELFTLTYGAMVSQLLKDYESIDEVNTQLEKMGYNIGLRIIDEFLAKSNLGSCHDFVETAEALAKVGFKMFLGISGNITSWGEERREFVLQLDENPLNDFVELPDKLREQNLWYSNIFCGVIRGALEMIQYRVECKFEKCVLRGDETTQIRVILKEELKETFIGDDD